MYRLSVSFFGATDVGKVRDNNEDAFIAQNIWDDRHILLVAIDGMGGEEGGEVAAEIARKSIIGYLEEFQNDTVLNLIKRAVTDANNEIVRNKEVQPQYRWMGCVATAGIIDLDECTLSVAHVGDSRLYRYSQGELTKLTHDHSFVGYQEEQGILTEEQAMKHPHRAIIERCVGSEHHIAEDDRFIEAAVFPLFGSETYIFCSDGLSDVLTSAQISECLSSQQSPEYECEKLIENANKAGGKDNITVVIAHVSESEDINTEGDVTESDVEDDIKVEDTPPSDSKTKRLVFKWLIVVLCSVILIALGFWAGTEYESQRSAEIITPTIVILSPETSKQETVIVSDTDTTIRVNNSAKTDE